MRKTPYSTTNMRDFNTGSTLFGATMIQILSQMKLKFGLEQQEVLEIYYYMALPGAEESTYELQHNDSDYILC